MHSDEKLVAILSGNDWREANVDFLVVPKELSLADEQMGQASVSPSSSFDSWLLKKSHARYAKPSEIETFVIGRSPESMGNLKPNKVEPKNDQD
jgi:hypothetical protein